MKNDKSIAWQQVWGIAAIQGSVTLAWVIYNLYFPQFLVQLGFAAGVAKTVLIIEHFLEAIIEPIFGSLSDRQQLKIGTRIPIISLGIVFASVFFISLPVIVILVHPQKIWAWLLPILAILWASSMAIFRSPAISLLSKSAPTNKLPQAVSIVSLIGGVIGAFRFDAYGIILKLGPSFAFFIGSITFLLAGFSLRFLFPPDLTDNLDTASNNKNVPKVKLLTIALIGIMGISISWALRFIIPIVKQVFTMQIGETNTKIAMMLFFLGLGILAIPAGKSASKIGNSLGILLGLVSTIILLQLLNFIPNLLIIILICASFTLVLNSVIPLVIILVPAERVGLGLGFYFGAFGAGMSFFDLIFSNLKLNQGIIASTFTLVITTVICLLTTLNKINK